MREIPANRKGPVYAVDMLASDKQRAQDLHLRAKRAQPEQGLERPPSCLKARAARLRLLSRSSSADSYRAESGASAQSLIQEQIEQCIMGSNSCSMSNGKIG